MDNFITVMFVNKEAPPLLCWKLDTNYRELKQEHYSAIPGYEIIVGRNMSINSLDYSLTMTKLSIISCDDSLRYGLCRVCGNGSFNITHYSKTTNGFEHINICIECYFILKTINIIETTGGNGELGTNSPHLSTTGGNGELGTNSPHLSTTGGNGELGMNSPHLSTTGGKMCVRNDCMCIIYNDEPDMIYRYCKKVIPGVWYPFLLDFREIVTCHDIVGVVTIKGARCVLCSYVYENAEYNVCNACMNMQRLVFLYDNTIKYMMIKEFAQKEEGKFADLFGNLIQGFL